MSKEKTNRFFNKALNQMFTMVGFSKFDPDFTKDPEWFLKKSWDQKTREDFKTWFFKEAKETLRWNKRTCQKEFEYFDFMYGWKLLDPEEVKKKKNTLKKITQNSLELGQ